MIDCTYLHKIHLIFLYCVKITLDQCQNIRIQDITSDLTLQSYKSQKSSRIFAFSQHRYLEALLAYIPLC